MLQGCELNMVLTEILCPDKIMRPELFRGNMKALADQIERQLALGVFNHCAVYEEELIHLWPRDDKEREAKIVKFAQEYGFRLGFYREGLCAIFIRADSN